MARLLYSSPHKTDPPTASGSVWPLWRGQPQDLLPRITMLSVLCKCTDLKFQAFREWGCASFPTTQVVTSVVRASRKNTENLLPSLLCGRPRTHPHGCEPRHSAKVQRRQTPAPPPLRVCRTVKRGDFLAAPFSLPSTCANTVTFPPVPTLQVASKWVRSRGGTLTQRKLDFKMSLGAARVDTQHPSLPHNSL